MISIGIDPGVNGGVAIIDDKWKDKAIEAVKCPDTIKDMADYLNVHCYDNIKTLCIIEKVHSFPGQGVRSVFTFGKNYGQWLGILASHDIPYKEVPPQTWMKHYGAMPRDKGQRKRHLKHLAQSLYPSIKVTLYNSDAILLANYSKMVYKSY
jgi:crossover junction endodeoxyribonuclease RuvC